MLDIQAQVPVNFGMEFHWLWSCKGRKAVENVFLGWPKLVQAVEYISGM